ncbi:MAG TPA: uroporphyrinogen-III synthase [Pararhizobium sp.]|uniref:uroporphyrinogen-III synthase n=1 Tax=Pararhizobium sp. TaxID=1977563 RepID=UPI002CD664EB|nr:uroporphyrinogen-III synthase [Pararhizobium sp.]HTO30331.1 uroporphyrinogen-III synthase [Pararhizobium sp.]
MRVLVTRPQPAAAATAARLEALGHEAILLPLMQAIHDPKAAMEALTQPHTAIAVTSAEAIRAMTADFGSDLTTPIYCVGAATADIARKSGFRAVIAGSGTGASLANLIIRASATRDGAGLLYLAGRPRSPHFETALAQAGIAFRVAEVYRMQPIEYQPDDIRAWLALKPQAVLFYSQETVRRFFRLVPASMLTDLRNIRLLCMSSQVADAVPNGLGQTAIAATPSEGSLLALL